MTYNLFISHSWSYSDAYEKLVRLLDTKPYFTYKNYSVPQNDPIHHASCVLILAGVYATYSKWINIEIDLANSMGKKIIAIQPWGAKLTSTVVKNTADVIVGWNTDSIVNAIRGY